MTKPDNTLHLFVFVIAQVVSEHILQSTVFLSKFLQAIKCDLLEATKECKTVIELFRAERFDESVWDELYQSVLDLSEPFDIVENMPRRCGRQTTRANHSADTPKQYWKVSLYYAFIDHMIMELESRLIKSENRFYAQYLLPRVILQRVRHRATSLLNSSKLHVRSVWYVSYNVAICSFVIFPITRGSRYCA